MTERTGTSPAAVFIAYAREDEPRLDELHKHLSLLLRQGKISVWHDREIEPGQEWEKAIDDQIGTADIILMLISADFVASDYCYGKEMDIAMRRNEAGEAIVVPIIVRPCDWHSAPFGMLQALPRDGEAVTDWPNQDSAWTNVAQGLRRVVEKSSNGPPSSDPALTSSARPVPIDRARSAITTLLSNGGSRIKVHQLVMDEVERIRTRLTTDPTFFSGPGLSGEEIAAQLPRLEAISETVMAYMANGCYWGESGHQDIWVRALIRLADVPIPNRNQEIPGRNMTLFRYPATLGLYAGGLGAVAAGQYGTLAALLTHGRLDDGYGRRVPLVIGLNPYAVMAIDVAKTMPGHEDQQMPFNQRICSLPMLRQSVSGLLDRESDFDATLDRFEYLLGLVHWDVFEQLYGSHWAPVSCFVWRDRNPFWNPTRMPTVQQVAAELNAQRERWGPLSAGLFGGSVDRAVSVMAAYNASIPGRPH